MGQMLTVKKIKEEIQLNNLKTYIIFLDFTKSFDSFDKNMMAEISRLYGIPMETVNAIKMLYKNNKSMFRYIYR